MSSRWFVPHASRDLTFQICADMDLPPHERRRVLRARLELCMGEMRELLDEHRMQVFSLVYRRIRRREGFHVETWRWAAAPVSDLLEWRRSGGQARLNQYYAGMRAMHRAKVDRCGCRAPWEVEWVQLYPRALVYR